MFRVCLNSISAFHSFKIYQVLSTWPAPLWWYTGKSNESCQWGLPGLGGARERHDGVNYHTTGVKKYCRHAKVKGVSPKAIYLAKQRNESSWSSGGLQHLGSHEGLFPLISQQWRAEPCEPSSLDREPSSALLHFCNFPLPPSNLWLSPCLDC